MLAFALVSLLAAPFAAAQTIADLVRANPQLTRAAAAISANPQWAAAGPYTLLVPTDGALGNAAGLGSFLANAAIDHRTTGYAYAIDTTGTHRLIFDNYTPGNPNPEIHVRFGTGEVRTTSQQQASNGWLYTLNGPIPPESRALATLEAIGATSFVSAVRSAGLATYVDGIRGFTILAPDNDAFTAARATIAALTPDQVRAVLLYHIIPTEILVSTQLGPRSLTTSLTGATIPMTLGTDPKEGHTVITLNGQGRITLADSFAVGGNVHLLNTVLVPANLPSGAVAIPPITGGGAVPPVVVTTTVAAATTTTTTASAATTTAARPTQAATNSAVGAAAGSLSAFIGGLLALVAF
ncbi:FAS1 domain-containing protein [Entophlyctis helioformis]|nr:FAS1 domain-containing protein [Entophlyctis helioformis]